MASTQKNSKEEIMTDIFERMRKRELIFESDSDYPILYEALLRGMWITGQLNASYYTPDQTREVLSELTGQKIDNSTWIVPLFYTNFDQFIRFWKKVFMNNGYTFMNRGDITLENGVFIIL
ncbi:MAG: hypothetical protein LBL90_03985 [Prevotellaceae bacterium]|jgi:acetyltransferase-like isoleucine patch superfamily enzyme|nr:hypothetical protein [Prevotellaceae bacterium]